MALRLTCPTGDVFVLEGSRRDGLRVAMEGTIEPAGTVWLVADLSGDQVLRMIEALRTHGGFPADSPRVICAPPARGEMSATAIVLRLVQARANRLLAAKDYHEAQRHSVDLDRLLRELAEEAS